MFMQTVLSFAAGAALSIGAGASGQAGDQDPRLGAQVDRICTGRSITGFEDATDRSVVVTASGGRHYLIETSGRCLGLEHAHGLSFEQHMTCISAGDGLIPARSVSMNRRGHGLDRRPAYLAGECRIAEIYEWRPDAAAQPEADAAER